MKSVRNVLIAIGVVALVLLIFFLVLGIKVVGTVFVWIMGALIILFIIGWIVYKLMSIRSRRGEMPDNT